MHLVSVRLPPHLGSWGRLGQIDYIYLRKRRAGESRTGDFVDQSACRIWPIRADWLFYLFVFYRGHNKLWHAKDIYLPAVRQLILPEAGQVFNLSGQAETLTYRKKPLVSIACFTKPQLSNLIKIISFPINYRRPWHWDTRFLICRLVERDDHGQYSQSVWPEGGRRSNLRKVAGLENLQRPAGFWQKALFDSYSAAERYRRSASGPCP